MVAGASVRADVSPAPVEIPPSAWPCDAPEPPGPACSCCPELSPGPVGPASEPDGVPSPVSAPPDAPWESSEPPDAIPPSGCLPSLPCSPASSVVGRASSDAPAPPPAAPEPGCLPAEASAGGLGGAPDTPSLDSPSFVVDGTLPHDPSAGVGPCDGTASRCRGATREVRPGSGAAPCDPSRSAEPAEAIVTATEELALATSAPGFDPDLPSTGETIRSIAAAGSSSTVNTSRGTSSDAQTGSAIPSVEPNSLGFEIREMRRSTRVSLIVAAEEVETHRRCACRGSLPRKGGLDPWLEGTRTPGRGNSFPPFAGIGPSEVSASSTPRERGTAAVSATGPVGPTCHRRGQTRGA